MVHLTERKSLEISTSLQEKIVEEEHEQSSYQPGSDNKQQIQHLETQLMKSEEHIKKLKAQLQSVQVHIYIHSLGMHVAVALL